MTSNNNLKIVEVSTNTNGSQFKKKKANTGVNFPLTALIICEQREVIPELTASFSIIPNVNYEVKLYLPNSVEKYNVVFLIVCPNSLNIKGHIKELSVQNKSTILIGDFLSKDVIRTAMQHKTHDILSLQELDTQLSESLANLSALLIESAAPAPLISVINGKAGSGASFITSCLGEVAASLTDKNIALVDADFYYGSLADMQNLETKYYLEDALDELDNLDDVAMRSMMAKRNNLHLLPVRPYSVYNNNFENVDNLLWKLKLSNELIFVDISRGLEQHNLPIVNQSDIYYIIVQQNIGSLREAKALIRQLIEAHGVNKEKIHVIINRFSSKLTNVNKEEVENVLGINSIFFVNNDFHLASSCTDLGAPLLNAANNKIIRKDITNIIRQTIFTSWMPIDESKGIFSKWFKR